jgi:hypothetical protein
MQLKKFNNKITDLDQIKRGPQSKKRSLSTVATRTQAPSKRIAEFIKYFDYLIGTGIVLHDDWGVLDRPVLGGSLKSLALMRESKSAKRLSGFFTGTREPT